MSKLGDKIKPEITAEWARKESTEILSVKVQEQLIKALDSIKNAIKNDNETATTHGNLHDKTKQILRSRGFKLDHHKGFDQRDPDYTTISW